MSKAYLIFGEYDIHHTLLKVKFNEQDAIDFATKVSKGLTSVKFDSISVQEWGDNPPKNIYQIEL